MSLLMWIAVHRFIAIIIGLLLTIGTVALFKFTDVIDIAALRIGAIGAAVITILFWCVSIYGVSKPVNMSSFTHLQASVVYLNVSKGTVGKASTLVLQDANGKQTKLTNADQYTVVTHTQGLATDQVGVQKRVANSNASTLQKQYFKIFQQRGLSASNTQANRGQLNVLKTSK